LRIYLQIRAGINIGLQCQKKQSVSILKNHHFIAWEISAELQVVPRSVDQLVREIQTQHRCQVGKLIPNLCTLMALSDMAAARKMLMTRQLLRA
jgi:hypothetical protein